MQTKTKILIPMFILTAILLFIGSTVTYSNYAKIVSLQKLNEKIVLATKVSSVLHTIQIERGLSCAFIVNKNNNFKNELMSQRAVSDKKIQLLKEELESFSFKNFEKKATTLLRQFSTINDTRNKIDEQNLSYVEIIKYYSHINTMLLDILINISKESHIPIVTKNILAYINLLYYKEYMGIERAQGVTIFSKKELSRESLLNFSNLIALEKSNESMFLKYASSDMRILYANKTDRSSFSQTLTMHNSLLYEDIKNSKISPKEWFEIITKNLNILDDVADYIEKEIVDNIYREVQELQNIFIILTILIVVSILVFILMLIAFFKLAREEQRLRTVTDKYIIFSTTDLKGNIIDVSAAFCSISGYTKQELIGKPHKIVRHPDMPKEIFQTMWFRISRGLSWSGKVKNRRKDGSFYWVYANVEPLFNSGGNIDSYISIRLDITESELLIHKVKEEEKKNKFHEEMIREQSRLAQMGEMISMIAHQWRQPLSAISAASGSLQLKAKRNRLDKETAIEIGDKIKGFSLHLSETIDDFRNFSKINKQENVTSFEKVFTDVLSIMEGSLKEHKIEISIKIENNQSFKTFENELKQVILNLIKNAEDALVNNKIKNPYIDIYITKNCFIIKDNAGGIPKNIIDKIFDPYFSTKTKKDGTGLGLYMSKMIIEDHCKGKLEVSNETTGAKFQITLGEDND